MSKYITRTVLEKEHTLAVLKDKFRGEMNQQNLLALLAVLRDSVVLVPGKLVFSDTDLGQMTEAQVGDLLRTSDEVHFVPDFFTTAEGEKYCPLFSDQEHIPEEYGNTFSFIHMTALECLRRAKTAADAKGIVLDPLDGPVSLMFETASFIEKIPSQLSPTQQKEDEKHPIKNMQVVLQKKNEEAGREDYFKGPLN